MKQNFQQESIKRLNKTNYKYILCIGLSIIQYDIRLILYECLYVLMFSVYNCICVCVCVVMLLSLLYFERILLFVSIEILYLENKNHFKNIGCGADLLK